MTHLNSSSASISPAPPMLTRSASHLDLQGLRDGIADRQRQRLDLEMELVAACEAEAARSCATGVRMDDRGTWDRTTWQRYLAAAAKLEPQYGPQLRQLHQEIDQLTRLVALPVAA